MKPKYYKQKWKTLTNGSNIKTLVSTRRAWESELASLPGQALAAQTLSIKGREERVKEMGVMSSSVHSPGDHGEESLPLPPGKPHWKSYWDYQKKLSFTTPTFLSFTSCICTVWTGAIVRSRRSYTGMVSYMPWKVIKLINF